ncbi:MAG: GTPase [Candidatus Woesearchaeota archaeon]
MAFTDIPPLPTKAELKDLPFTRALKIKPEKKLSPEDKSRKLATLRSQAFQDTVQDMFMRTVKGFPSLDSMTEFYRELTTALIKEERYRKDLATLMWITKNVKDCRRELLGRLKDAKTPMQMSAALKGFYGRSASFVQRAVPVCERLREDRALFMTFPSVKDGLFTVCLVGFPNVGKSTLLSKITTAKPEIKDYAFTTKQLNLGYFEAKHHKVQIIDTPGSLNRFEKMNQIEKQAYLAMKYVADVLVWVYDPTPSYTFEKQWAMYEKTLELLKPTLCYVSKTDLLDDEDGIPPKVRALKPLMSPEQVLEKLRELRAEEPS